MRQRRKLSPRCDSGAKSSQWARNRQRKAVQLARSVRVSVNVVATQHGLMDRRRGVPNADMVAAPRISRCDPRIELADTLEQLAGQTGDDGARTQLTELRRCVVHRLM